MDHQSLREQLRQKLSTDEGLRMAIVNQGARRRELARRLAMENVRRRNPIRHTIRITRAMFPAECAIVEQQLIAHQE